MVTIHTLSARLWCKMRNNFNCLLLGLRWEGEGTEYLHSVCACSLDKVERAKQQDCTTAEPTNSLQTREDIEPRFLLQKLYALTTQTLKCSFYLPSIQARFYVSLYFRNCISNFIKFCSFSFLWYVTWRWWDYKHRAPGVSFSYYCIEDSIKPYCKNR